MFQKINIIKNRRNWLPWNPTNPIVSTSLEIINTTFTSLGRSHAPNILMILADDLGYGDLSVSPFVVSPLLDPHKIWPCREGFLFFKLLSLFFLLFFF